VGLNSLRHNTTGTFNSALGVNSLLFNSTGSQNVGIGYQALDFNTTATHNTGVGFQALFTNNANDNTAVGWRALFHNNTGANNVATGSQALFSNTIGGGNTANGVVALFSNTIGNSNTATGVNALFSNTTGHENTAMGSSALVSNTTGSGNTALGFGAGFGVTMANNVIAIGANGANVNDSCFIGNIRGVTTVNAAIPVLIDTVGQLGTASSSRRYKKEIKPMEQASEAIHSLKPVTFHYKSDATSTPQFGLIAEEVAEVNPDLVVRDENGDIYTVRYEAVNAMLLNEFLKEHRKMEEQEATIAQLKKDFQSKLADQQNQIKALASGLEKVSAQLEVNKPAPQVVRNNQ